MTASLRPPAVLLTAILLLAGCGPSEGDAEVFVDTVATNVEPATDLSTLVFTSRDGKTVRLSEYLGKKPLVLVITRGFGGALCPYCTTQTSRLISNYSRFQKLGAEVLLVYPLESASDLPHAEQFVAGANAAAGTTVPFPVLLDVELKAVDQLDLRRSLSKPATYIFDRAGHLHFAYVGETVTDRPSIKALLGQLESLQSAAGA